MTRSGEFDAIVIGAGFSGLYMLHRLRDQLGVSVRVFEAGGDVGGTWYWNRYPGARCDSEGYVYCYSFSKELLEEWRWSGRYPTQPEILAYLRHVADRFDLRRDIQFDTRVLGAAFDEDERRWTVETDEGSYSARFLITAVGVLASVPLYPDLPGLDSFRGECHHTGRWPHHLVEFAGKRVGVLGTGSTGVQAIPVIAREAAQVYVFQRSPQFTVPAHHAPVTAGFNDWLTSNYDAIWETARHSAGGFPWQHNGESALEATPEERERTFEALWAEGGFKFLFGSYKDILMDRRANDFAAEFIRSKIRERVDDPDVAERLLPVDHPFGARRPIVDTDYFEAYNRDNVTLVDVRHFPIREVTPAGMLTERCHYELDVLVLATGYDAVTGPFKTMDIRGRGGQRLGEKWAAGPNSYLGISTAGFPNLFTIVGPGSMFGNYPMPMEHHVEWISDCVRYVLDQGTDVIEASDAAESRWMEQLDEQAERTLISLADSWFTGANVPGKQQRPLFYLGSFGRYRKTCDEVAAAGYEGFVFSP